MYILSIAMNEVNMHIIDKIKDIDFSKIRRIDATKNVPELNQEGTDKDFEYLMKCPNNEISVEKD